MENADEGLYFPQYPILRREDIVEDIRVNPEEELDSFALAELSQLRRGITTYNIAQVDTPESREAIALKVGYFQMVAFKEGWRFFINSLYSRAIKSII